MDKPRLIEYAFPLKQASLDSVHEKNVRHGHISTLHIWPARRPLAACRAALIATLLPDPGDPEKRKELIDKLGGKVVEKIERKKMPSGKIVDNIKQVMGELGYEDKSMVATVDHVDDRFGHVYNLLGDASKAKDKLGWIPEHTLREGLRKTALWLINTDWGVISR